MARVIVHATVTVDGFIADADGGVDWMFGRPSAPEDDAVVEKVIDRIGAVVGGANKAQTVEDGEIPYGGMLKVPVYLMTHSAHEPIERDGVTYTFVVDDVAQAVEAAKQAAGDEWVNLLGGSISRQCLLLGLVDELHLDVA
ncbi:dihydrofolate reductase family protein, partial [Georgenia subflava]